MELSNKIIVCHNSTKLDILANQHQLHKYKFASITDVFSAVYFTYANNATFYIHNHYNLPISVVKEIKNYLYFIQDKKYNSSKLNFLKKIKKELIENNIIYINKPLQNLFQKYDCLLYNVTQTKKNDLVLSKLNEFTNATFYKKSVKNNEVKIFKLKTKEDEFSFIFKEIVKLLENGLNPNEISIHNVKSGDYHLLHKMSTLFKVDVNVPTNGSIYNSNIIVPFFNALNNCSSFADVLGKLEEFKNEFAYNKIIDIINSNELLNIKPKLCVNFFKNELKNIGYERISFENAISLDNIEAKEHFFVNFNEGLAPQIVKDEGYLSSNELEELGLDSIDDLNKLNQDELFDFINDLKKLVITYHEQEDGIEIKPSPVIDKIGIKAIEPEYEYGYSFLMDEIHLATIVDAYLKYGIKDESIDRYDLSFMKKKYDNSFNFADFSLYEKYFNELNKIVLSYSSMNTYTRCPFSYYISKVLKIDPYQENLGAKLGTFAHEMLQKSYEVDFSLNVESENYISNINSPKEKFYASCMLATISKAINFNREYEAKSMLKEMKFENEVNLALDDKYDFKGFIDKVMYQVCGDEVNVAIIDYKTSKYDILELKNIKDGLNLQLPVYVYLLSKCDLFAGKKINIIGIYLQHILREKYNDEALFTASFKLQGYTIDEYDKMALIDPDYINSTYIKSLKVTSKGLYRYAKVLTQTDFNKLIPIVENRINVVCEGIKNADFKIAPIKVIGDKYSVCQYCEYKDICYVRSENIREIEPNSFEEVSN